MSKIRAEHLQRKACVYVRQSTMKQVLENSESTDRQYGLADRARQLGWCTTAVEIIDEDLGKSGTTAAPRKGFTRLAQAVAHGEVGAIFAIEVSRLARSSQDWQRLLSLCTVARVLVVDEHTIYDPAEADDKLLLDLKGTMSEAELTWLRLRLRGAKLNKARRGELHLRPATGYVWGGSKFEFDPDESVCAAIRTLLERFTLEPSARAVVRWARETNFLVPTRQFRSDAVTDMVWRPLTMGRIQNMLHNPVYAGAYTYGKSTTRKILTDDGDVASARHFSSDPESWAVFIRDAHEGFISWEQYERNLAKLQANARGTAGPTAPREGAALLAGLTVCGRCGRRMGISYHGKSNRRQYYYICFGNKPAAGPSCWSVSGRDIDNATETLFLQTMVPSELELSLAVEQVAATQAESLASQWRMRVERARRAVCLAERRYKAVDPEHRVVVRTLERQWDEALREVEDVERQYAKAKREHRVELNAQDRAQIRAIAHNLSDVWQSATTKQADRKAMLRLVIQAVTLLPVDVPSRETLVRVQWHSGAASELGVSRPTRAERLETPPEVLDKIRELVSQGLPARQVAVALNEAGVKPKTASKWIAQGVRSTCTKHGIERPPIDPERYVRRLPARHPDGRYSLTAAAQFLDVNTYLVKKAIQRGILQVDLEVYLPFGQHPVRWIRLDDDDVASFRTYITRGRSLPARRPNGSYSVKGLAEHLAVPPWKIQRWLNRGDLKGVRETFEHHPESWWIYLDDTAMMQLEEKIRG
ncbi:MAG: recombinase family protein [Phycisphaerales bacterium]|nr:recombinase family protein [Phycisphaerales bacterium]